MLLFLFRPPQMTSDFISASRLPVEGRLSAALDHINNQSHLLVYAVLLIGVAVLAAAVSNLAVALIHALGFGTRGVGRGTQAVFVSYPQLMLISPIQGRQQPNTSPRTCDPRETYLEEAHFLLCSPPVRMGRSRLGQRLRLWPVWPAQCGSHPQSPAKAFPRLVYLYVHGQASRTGIHAEKSSAWRVLCIMIYGTKTFQLPLVSIALFGSYSSP